MLLTLAQWLQSISPEYGYLRVFQYLTFRAVMAALTALLIGLMAGPAVIRKLAELKIGQPIRGYGVESHLSKSGTPTMGGVLILLSIAFSTLMWVDLSNRFVWIVLAVTLGFGAIGWVDDWRKVVNKDPEGMPSREKYLWQSLIGLLAALYLVFSISEVSNLRVLELFYSWVRSGFDVNLPPKAGLMVPFFKTVSYPLGVFGFVLLSYFVIVGTSNAVNLTDGLDGLAIMPCVMVAGALGVFAYVTGRVDFAAYLQIPYVAYTGELAVFLAALVGAGDNLDLDPFFPQARHIGGQPLELGRRMRRVKPPRAAEIAVDPLGLDPLANPLKRRHPLAPDRRRERFGIPFDGTGGDEGIDRHGGDGGAEGIVRARNRRVDVQVLRVPRAAGPGRRRDLVDDRRTRL